MGYKWLLGNNSGFLVNGSYNKIENLQSCNKIRFPYKNNYKIKPLLIITFNNIFNVPFVYFYHFHLIYYFENSKFTAVNGENGQIVLRFKPESLLVKFTGVNKTTN